MKVAPDSTIVRIEALEAKTESLSGRADKTDDTIKQIESAMNQCDKKHLSHTKNLEIHTAEIESLKRALEALS